MFGAGARSRLALIFRRLRGRYGVATPPVAVRLHWPWYLRALVIIALLSISMALAYWIYDAGSRFAGFRQQLSEKEITEMRERIATLTTEVEEGRKLINASESRLRIECTSQGQLTTQIKTLEEENTRLKADIAMFENLAGGPQTADTGLAISRLQVEPVGAGGQYRYRLLVAQTGEKKEREFNGMLQFVATVQRGKDTVMMQVPQQVPQTNDPAASQFKVNFRHFRRYEGTISLGGDGRVVRVEARLLQDGSVKASRSIML